ncbi:MAG: hypothetical protein ACR2M1_08980 [Gemmatimonadaceae bacterium]
MAAEIDTEGFINVTSPDWKATFEGVHEAYAERCAAARRALPRQTAFAHREDCELLNYFAWVLEQRGLEIPGFFGAFVEGEPVYEGSAFWSQAHVQIVVRRPDRIERVWLIERPGPN